MSTERVAITLSHHRSAFHQFHSLTLQHVSVRVDISAPHCTLSSVDQLAVDGGGDDRGGQILQETSESVSQRNHVVLIQIR